MTFNGMTGMGQYNMTRKGSVTVQQQPKTKKQGFFSEDEDSEPNMYGSSSLVFNPKDMSINSSAFQPLDHDRSNSSVFTIRESMTSPSSQLATPFGTNLYTQPGIVASLQQRGMSNTAGFPQRSNNAGHVTPTSMPTSMSSSFPINVQQQASPNRNLFPSIGQQGLISRIPTSQIQKRTNPITSGMLSSNTNSITSMPGFGRSQFDCFGTGDSSQPSLDLSEFPTLGNRSVSSNPSMPAPRNYGVVVNKQITEPTPEFQIQQEDFPALPGAQNPPSSQSNDTSSKTATSTSGSGSYEQAVSKDGKFPGDKTGGQTSKRGIQTHQDGTVSNIPLGMVNDQFGMVGLLTFIRGAETDPNLVALAPGIDLTTLGLNLNSPENLYSTFQSPWADSPCRPQDIDFHVPSEYLTNIFIKEKLAPIKLNRYGEDLLFFLFYMNGGDVLQLAAAAELYSRDWRYHKEERLWITRATGMEPMVKTNSYERGTYYFFDAQNWRKVLKEFHLEYDKLEDHPHLPQFHQTQTQPIMAH